jgi:hypothetical protein
MLRAFPDRFERAMIDFATRWYRYGGGSSSEIFEEFGLREEVFFRRVLDLMETDARNARCINAVLNYHIRSICRLRLAAINHSTTRRDDRPTARRDASAHRLDATRGHPAQMAHTRREARLQRSGDPPLSHRPGVTYRSPTPAA